MELWDIYNEKKEKMGRTKKKPGYDQNRIMEQFQNCIVEAYTSGMTDGSSISILD